MQGSAQPQPDSEFRNNLCERKLHTAGYTGMLSAAKCDHCKVMQSGLTTVVLVCSADSTPANQPPLQMDHTSPIFSLPHSLRTGFLLSIIFLPLPSTTKEQCQQLLHLPFNGTGEMFALLSCIAVCMSKWLGEKQVTDGAFLSWHSEAPSHCCLTRSSRASVQFQESFAPGALCCDVTTS